MIGLQKAEAAVSLGVVIKGPEGIVLAADSRVTLTALSQNAPPVSVNFDNATKLLSFGTQPHFYVGAVTYGAAVIGLRTAHSFIPEFELGLATEPERLTVREYARRLSEFFLSQWTTATPPQPTGLQMTFVVAGFDPQSAYGSVFTFDIPGTPEPTERNAGEQFGMTWGGQHEIVGRIIHGYDPALLPLLQHALDLSPEQLQRVKQAIAAQQLEYRIPYMVLPLQDCVDLATFLIRTTMTAQELAVAVRGVGGPIDVAYITRTKRLTFVQQKRIRGEAGSTELSPE
jgi:20S proteasome alpha/beta subunit